MRVLSIAIAIVFINLTTGYSQAIYKMNRSSVVDINGTSTLHDWEMKSTMPSGQVLFNIEGTVVKDVSELTFTMAAESLKSGKDAMDKNAYKSLKTSSNKNITFQSTRVVSIEKSGSGYLITCEGKLQIAGTTKVTQVKAVCSGDVNAIHCKGEKKFKMSEYNVEPPSFMFGTVKTGDELTITFDITFTK